MNPIGPRDAPRPEGHWAPTATRGTTMTSGGEGQGEGGGRGRGAGLGSNAVLVSHGEKMWCER